jgi:hypothetical protein
VRRADDDGALDPIAYLAEVDERLCCHQPRVSVARVRRNDPTGVEPLLDAGGREEVADGLA